jgi:hypothetical protein
MGVMVDDLGGMSIDLLLPITVLLNALSRNSYTNVIVGRSTILLEINLVIIVPVHL